MSNNPSSFSFVRPYVPEDKNFILATFLRGLYYGNEFYGMIPKDVFMENYRVVGEALLAHPNTQVLVSSLKEDPSIILGYSLVSKDLEVLHWTFCKTAWRRQGVMNSLLPKTLKTYTHFTTLGLKLNEQLNLTFNPFKLT